VIRQYSTILMQYSAVQCWSLQCSVMRWNALQHSKLQYRAVVYSTAQYYTVQHSTKLLKISRCICNTKTCNSCTGTVLYLCCKMLHHTECPCHLFHTSRLDVCIHENLLLYWFGAFQLFWTIVVYFPTLYERVQIDWGFSTN
jgi:hypothetical protein